MAWVSYPPARQSFTRANGQGGQRILIAASTTGICLLLMPSYSSRSRCRICAIVALVTLPVAACTKTESAQAHGREAAAKTVKVEVVREETVRRAVEVVGTLAAVDQVTISSEADGEVSRILADLGDRVSASQPLIRLDSEKQQYSSD